MMHRVLLTGAAGGIGRRMRTELSGSYPVLRVSDIESLGEAAAGEEVAPADLTDPDAVDRLLEGVDGVIHLGGLSVEHDWADIVRINIDATYRFFESAHRAGVKRIVFASSNHSVGFYPRSVCLTGDERPRPDSRYGLSKVFGEALGQYFADNYAMGVLSIRIGWCHDEPRTPRSLKTWISIRDLTALCRIGLDAPDLHHEIVWGVSGNSGTWWDNETAFRLGFRPRDSSDDRARALGPAGTVEPGDAISLAVQGGVFAAQEFEGDADRFVGAAAIPDSGPDSGKEGIGLAK